MIVKVARVPHSGLQVLPFAMGCGVKSVIMRQRCREPAAKFLEKLKERIIIHYYCVSRLINNKKEFKI